MTKGIRSIRPIAVLAVAAVLVVSCSNSNSSGKGKVTPGSETTASMATPASSTTTPQVSASNPMVVNSVAKTASIFVSAGQGGGLNFDGQQSGTLQITVPLGWSITLSCHNASSTPHSCAIVQSATSASPVFPGAETSNPVAGMGPGQTQSFTFTAAQAGSFRLVCLVPGHEDAGMWGTFVVSASAASPAIAT